MSTAPAVRIAAHAKVNLFLRILARETSGFHQIETAFALLELADDLVLRRIDSGVTLEIDGPDLGPVEENLAVRAARMVLDATGKRFGVAITLTKRIPVRAGLGGGSSDAAAALHAVNGLAGNAVPRHELLHFGARLGADVAFFTAGAALAVAWGRGERQFRLPAPPSLPALIAMPPLQVATPDAYAWWDEQNRSPAPRGPVTLDPDVLSTWGSIGRLGGNDFEAVVFAKHPELRTLYERLAETGPVWVRMCGSGSALAAVYKKESERDEAMQRLGTNRQALIATATRALAAPPPETVTV
ncbi:MAG: 4-(cytidine 5'-diphospho)-2-C-methyl-D-erythritol kinase [Gemmatimonadetes bacterium 13_1_40CM_66_11]|nr:MAG: 4-(cytidine 5'-diphospho)-2-C-methyl-D-erythritol kinase [Gemmatimonadetes bacterium 13_1_40CM_66_11]